MLHRSVYVYSVPYGLIFHCFAFLKEEQKSFLSLVKGFFVGFGFAFFFNITAGILCGTEHCNNICAYQPTIWVGGKWLNLVHMHEVNENLTIAGLQITNTTENQRLGRGYRKPKGKDYLSGIILFLPQVSSAFIQSSDSARACLVRKSLKVKY